MSCKLVRTIQDIAYDYSKYHRDEKEYSKDEELFRNIFRKRFKLITKYKSAPGLVLEIGSSTGILLELFKNVGWKTYGIEPSKLASRIAKQKGIKIYNNYLEDTNLPNNFFDVVIMNHTLEHVSDPTVVLKEIHRVLKPDGIVYIDVPNFGSLDSKIKKRNWKYLMPSEHNYHFTSNTLTTIVKNSGLEVLKLRTYSGVCDVSNPISKFWYQLTHFKKAFFKDLAILPLNLITTCLNRGANLTILCRKP